VLPALGEAMVAPLQRVQRLAEEKEVIGCMLGGRRALFRA
jgi:hypothetical protein